MTTTKRATRRQNTINRLEAQLKSGKKPGHLEVANGRRKTTNSTVDLTDKDKSRISKEIDTLKERI